MKTVAFDAGVLCERGTTVALFDYAFHNQKTLGNKSIVFYREKGSVPRVLAKFQKCFELISVKDFSEIDLYLAERGIGVIYILRSGEKGPVSKVAKTCIHAVFTCHEPHGDVFAAIAPWVNGNEGKYPVVPHMVDLPLVDGDLRDELGIPEEAVVFGGYGGASNFNIPAAVRAVYRVALTNPAIYFLFANFHQFCPPPPNIIHLPMIIDVERKARFINTCDAMIWGRADGEVMSQSMGEFSVKNKPIICTKYLFPEKNLLVGYHGHVHLLGEKAIWYKTEDDLVEILTSFVKKDGDWNAYKEFTPEKVMERFRHSFLMEGESSF